MGCGIILPQPIFLSSQRATLTQARKCAPTDKYNTTTTPNTRTDVPPLKGLNKCFNTLNPGLAPWAMKKYRPVGAHCPTAPIPPQYHKQYNQTKHEQTQQSIYTPLNVQANPTKSPARATLLQSPGWNEGKARYETLGKRR